MKYARIKTQYAVLVSPKFATEAEVMEWYNPRAQGGEFGVPDQIEKVGPAGEEVEVVRPGDFSMSIEDYDDTEDKAVKAKKNKKDAAKKALEKADLYGDLSKVTTVAALKVELAKTNAILAEVLELLKD